MHCCIEHIHSDKTRCMAMAITELVEITKDNPFLEEKGGTTVRRRSMHTVKHKQLDLDLGSLVHVLCTI